jgi:hypothetical protein
MAVMLALERRQDQYPGNGNRRQAREDHLSAQ